MNVLVDTDVLLDVALDSAIRREAAARLDELFTASGVDHIEVQTDRDYVRDLVRFFRAREHRR